LDNEKAIAKALEQVATEMAEMAQGVPNLRRELRIIQITLEMQEKKLEEIQQLLKERQHGDNRETNLRPAAENV